MIRVAAVGDIHMGPESQGVLRPAFDTLPDCADILLLAGDLTRHGTPEEARVVAEEVRGLPVPVVAVLGNHDHHDDRPEEVTEILQDAGVHVLEGRATVVSTAHGRIGVAGTKGFGGGFVGRSAGEFGEPVMKEFVRYSRRCADGLRRSLEELGEQGCDARVALTHFSPVAETLAGEPLEIYPFLGSYLLAEAIDTAGADLAVHGHAHAGSEHGMTSGGVRVRNVAQPVIRRAFNVYHLQTPEPEPAAAPAGGGHAWQSAEDPAPGFMT
ncbi:metallophosphoesterase family protein [Streptomyces sp. CRN 30]|uniref:metallophosphoesterase family protein n=1 Tax=Streptomyces sp. CRN 30 TaxID=3075613 RepID=UPI002A83347F|nr:metallophosphoesterase [Streptomyces sp. CRN 30]